MGSPCDGGNVGGIGGIGHNTGFALLVVLFILLIIVGTAFCY
ncbi:YjcZ family sporulation protein [Sporolactobacillus vineae]|nr:YjcZ family sporulation protein [Sporolactobacillus vineae]